MSIYVVQIGRSSEGFLSHGDSQKAIAGRNDPIDGNIIDQPAFQQCAAGAVDGRTGRMPGEHGLDEKVISASFGVVEKNPQSILRVAVGAERAPAQFFQLFVFVSNLHPEKQ